jgi:hypothetical protein
MKTIGACAFVAGLVLTIGAHAAAPADAPPGTTGLCKDGTYYSGAEKKGACKGHKGVKDWYATDTAAPKTDAKTDMKQGAAMPAASAPASKKTAAMPSPASAAAPGGGPGMVWANESSKVYHCPDDKWYGKTKKGEYMSEADAKAKGFKADHGKACKA